MHRPIDSPIPFLAGARSGFGESSHPPHRCQKWLAGLPRRAQAGEPKRPQTGLICPTLKMLESQSKSSWTWRSQKPVANCIAWSNRRKCNTMNFYSGKFLRRSLANGSTVFESTFKYAELARPFKYTDGTGVSYYLRGLAVWPALIALQIFKCHDVTVHI